MKLQLKTIVAAAALIAAAGHASAAINGPSTATGSDLLFFVFDDATKTSYVQDLGKTYSGFLPTAAGAGQNFSAAVGTNSAWTSYLTSVGNNTSNSYWGVVAGLRANAGNSGNGLQSTVRTGYAGLPATQTAAATKSAVGGPLANVISGINGATGGVTPTTGYFSSSVAGDNWANNFGHDGGLKLTFKVDNLIGTSAAFQYIDSNAIPLTGTMYSAGSPVFSFDGNNLNYAVAIAAVPEPSTYAMMLTGLMLVGGIAARRRNSAK